MGKFPSTVQTNGCEVVAGAAVAVEISSAVVSAVPVVVSGYSDVICSVDELRSSVGDAVTPSSVGQVNSIVVDADVSVDDVMSLVGSVLEQ